MISSRRTLTIPALVGTLVAIAFATAASGALAPNKAWRGDFKVYGTPVTLKAYSSGKITMAFTASCSFAGKAAEVKAVGVGRRHGGTFTIAKATASGGTGVDAFTVTGGKASNASASGKVSATFGRDVAGAHYRCSLDDSFTAKRLKRVP
ncbi:MAG: hypothetical protein JWQ18_1339 [Conexibacter sp.]|nr:hypothetical protein [Conexibacter sp.]